MASVYVTEYAATPGDLPIAMLPAIATRVLTPTTSGVVSTAPFDAATNFIRVHTDGIISHKMVESTGSLAAITDPRMAAGQTEYFGIRPGNTTQRFSVITNT